MGLTLLVASLCVLFLILFIVFAFIGAKYQIKMRKCDENIDTLSTIIFEGFRYTDKTEEDIKKAKKEKIDLIKEKEQYSAKRDKCGKISVILSIIFVICLVVLIILGMIIMSQKISLFANIKLQELQAEKDLLLFRIENIDKNILEEKELYSAISSFNSNVIKNKEAMNNKWLNWFISSAYENIEIIKL